MNIPETITPEQADELDAIRNELFYLYLDSIDVRIPIEHRISARKLAKLYNRTACLYAAIAHRGVVTIESIDQVHRLNTTAPACFECLAPEGTFHFDGCEQA